MLPRGGTKFRSADSTGSSSHLSKRKWLWWHSALREKKKSPDFKLNWIPHLTRKAPKGLGLNIWVGGRRLKGEDGSIRHINLFYISLILAISHDATYKPESPSKKTNRDIWLKSFFFLFFFFSAFRCSCSAEVGCVRLWLCAGIRSGVQIWIVPLANIHLDALSATWWHANSKGKKNKKADIPQPETRTCVPNCKSGFRKTRQNENYVQ